MSAEQIFEHPPIARYSYTELIHDALFDALIRMHNTNTWEPEVTYDNCLLQRLYAESVRSSLSNELYFKKFGNKTITVVLRVTQDPYQYKIGLSIS